MNASQQHMLDAYRAAQHGEPAPVLPGIRTVTTAREIRRWRRFRTLVMGALGRGEAQEIRRPIFADRRL